MKNNFKVMTLFILISLVIVSATSVYAQTPDQVKFGLMFGLTGAASPVGPVQRDGAILAIEELNNNGGIEIDGEKVPVEFVVRDDETKPDVALRRLRELIYQENADIILGQTFASISSAVNEAVSNMDAAYFPVNVVPLGMFEKGVIGESSYAIHGSAYAAGYASAAYIINELGYEDIVFFGPAYAFGRDQWEGAKDAIEKYDATYSYIESPVGTTDYTSYIQQIKEKDPEIVMIAHWGNDAINALKQVYELGLKEDTEIWFDWMTNVFGTGVPEEAISGVYSLMSWYWNMEGFENEMVVESSNEFSTKFQNRFGYPPDPYSAMAYLGVKEAARAIEIAGSTNPAKISEAIDNNPNFDSMKGPGTWREDHQPVFDYGAFVVKGKTPEERDGKYDIVEIIGAYKGEDYLPDLEMLGY